MNGRAADAETREENVVEQVCESAWWPGESVDYSQIGSMVALALAAAAVVVSLARADWHAPGDRSVAASVSVGSVSAEARVASR